MKYSKNPKKVTVYDVLDEIKSECEKLGANGIINLSLEYHGAITRQSAIDGAVLEAYPAITARGMAIKKKINHSESIFFSSEIVYYFVHILIQKN